MRSSNSAFSPWFNSSISNKLKSLLKVFDIASNIDAFDNIVTSVAVFSGTSIDSSNLGIKFFLGEYCCGGNVCPAIGTDAAPPIVI